MKLQEVVVLLAASWLQPIRLSTSMFTASRPWPQVHTHTQASLAGWEPKGSRGLTYFTDDRGVQDLPYNRSRQPARMSCWHGKAIPACHPLLKQSGNSRSSVG